MNETSELATRHCLSTSGLGRTRQTSGLATLRRLATCDTAGWQPALQLHRHPSHPSNRLQFPLIKPGPIILVLQQMLAQRGLVASHNEFQLINIVRPPKPVEKLRPNELRLVQRVLRVTRSQV